MSTKISFLALNNYQPLDTLTPENLKEIAEKLEVFEFKKGDNLFKEGDKDDHHIFLYKGNADLVKAGKILKTIEAGTDVRLPAEFESAHIKGATHMPLIFLRMKMSELDQMVNYIIYCDTERRSSSASYILSEKGFKTSVLLNGIKDVPTDDLEGANL